MGDAGRDSVHPSGSPHHDMIGKTRSNSTRMLRGFLRQYGLGLIFAANIFGAGSIFILAKAGISYGFTLIWTLPLSLLIGMVMHELAMWLSLEDTCLMHHLYTSTGQTSALGIAGLLALIMPLWATSNFAAFGMALQELMGLKGYTIPFAVAGAVASLGLVATSHYPRIETVISLILGAFILSFTMVLLMNPPTLSELAGGTLPRLGGWQYLTMVISLLGTTVYYPNFWIQTSMQETKGWDINRVRATRVDNLFGLTVAIIASIIVLSVTAINVDRLATIDFVTPALALQPLGSIASGLFLVGILLASFTSATGTLFALGFIIPQARGRNVSFSDRQWKLPVITAIIYGVLLIPIGLTLTPLGVVDIAILFPALNGAIGLPLTVVALYHANLGRDRMKGSFRIAAFLVMIVLLLASGLTVKSLITALLTGIA